MSNANDPDDDKLYYQHGEGIVPFAAPDVAINDRVLLDEERPVMRYVRRQSSGAAACGLSSCHEHDRTRSGPRQFFGRRAACCWFVVCASQKLVDRMYLYVRGSDYLTYLLLLMAFSECFSLSLERLNPLLWYQSIVMNMMEKTHSR